MTQHKFLLRLVYLASVSPSATLCAGQSVSYRPLLLTGDSISAVPAATVSAVTLLDGLSDAGETTVRVTFAGAVTSLNDTALVTVGTAPRILAREGDFGPGSTLIIANVGSARTAPSGAVGILPILGTTPTTGLRRSIYWISQPSAEPTLVLQHGAPAPGLPAGLSVNSVGLFGNVESDGHMTINGFLQGPGVSTINDQVLYRRNPSGSLELIGREGDPAPGFPSGVFLDASLSPVINRNHRSLLSGFLRGTGISATNDQAAFVSADAGLNLLVKQSSTSTPRPEFYYLISPLDMLSDGRSYVLTYMFSAPQSFDGQAIVSGYANGPLSVVRRSDGQVEGRPTAWLGAALANDRGNLAYVAQLQTSEYAFVVAPSETDPSADRFLAIQGTQAPGTEALWGRPFTDPNSFYLNENGVVVFPNILEGTTVNASTDGTIWAADAWGRLQLIAREGDPLILSPGDVRIVASLNLDNIQLSETNIIAFHATFTDGSAGIVTATVPEPLTASTLISVLLAAVSKRRRAQAVREA